MLTKKNPEISPVFPLFLYRVKKLAGYITEIETQLCNHKAIIHVMM